MKVMIVTDAWSPQVNGVVTTLGKIGDGLRDLGHEARFLTPQGFRSIPCPTYPEIRLSLLPFAGVSQEIEAFAPDAVHIATEGPLGMAARRYCLARKLAFTTAFHTRFAEYVHARIRIPVDWTYRWLRGFHAPSRAVMVPTPSVRRDLQARGFANTVDWTRGVDTETFCPGERDHLTDTPPIFLYVGRVAVEKNLEAFLELDLPGSKWVVGEGPLRAALERKYPGVRFEGIKTPAELARYYRAADVFVFPSLTDTFGLVMLEALACGTPVAAFPVPGPLDVIGDSGAGVLHEDLAFACLGALNISRDKARRYAEQFSWCASVEQFVRNLTPIR
ncbi:MAG TPA: glycosyltransferase family 1 protein [Burkholderiales bacterium]|nr:glycosyltransferase family 1 protein [Burkholderiales bacterium]